MKSLLPLLPLLVLATASVQDVAKTAKRPEVGKPAPALRLNDHHGNIVELGGKRADWTVLAFFPKAATPGWTLEICSLRDAAETLKTIGADVFTLSLDSVQELAQFAEKQKAPYMMLSDPDGSVAAKYGVLDPSGKSAQRVTFLIDEQGILRKVIDQVNVKTHGEDLAVVLEELRK